MPAIFIFMCLVLFLGTAVQPRADERYAPLAQMPMDIAETGSPVIPAQVNDDGPFWFLLDTGATGTTIRPPLVEKLKLPKMAAQVSGLQSMGGTLSADLYRVDSIHYGPLESLNLLAPVFERPNLRSHPIQGVAGIDLMRAHAVEFDFAARTIRLHRDFQGSRGWIRLPTRFTAAGYAFVPISINGARGEAFVDTGASTTILNPAFVRALGLSADGPGVRKSALIGGVEGARIPLYATRKTKVRLGQVPLPDAPAQFADLPIFERLGAPGVSVAILGADLMKGQRFVVDYPGKSVWWHVD